MLLVLSCSQVKRPLAAGVAVPFVELYAGPMWQQVRKAGFPADQVAAISARYGVLAPGARIPTYDEKMTDAAAAAFCAGAAPDQLGELVDRAGGAFVVGGALYQAIAREAVRRRPELAARVTLAGGSFLQLRRQLGEWLRAC